MLDLSRLALYKQVNAKMLLLEDEVEVGLKSLSLLVAATGHGDRLAFARCGALFDKVFDVVVVNVVCVPGLVGRGSLQGVIGRR